LSFRLGRAVGVAFRLKGKEKRGCASLSPGTVDQQILRYAAKEAAGIGEAVALLAARRARENFLHEIRRFFRPRLSAKKMKEPRTMRPKSVIEVASLRRCHDWPVVRSEENTSELQSLMRISYDVFCLTKKKQ